MTIQEIFKSFNKLNVLIIGDVMIDAYMWGQVSRISPEAPVPIVAVNKKENRLGGAANVALNVQAMGATPILCAVIGDDEHAITFNSLLKKQKLSAEGIIKGKKRVTTVKTRIIGNHHQMLRIDEEIESPIDKKETEDLFEKIQKLITSKKIDVIIFEDYDKGVITPELISKVVKTANQKNIPTVVDPKKKNFMAYSGVSLFKPNLKELKEGLKLDFNVNNTTELSKIVDSFIKKQKIATALITLSEKGVYIHTQKTRSLIPAHIRDITDVSGAGDTVVSLAALCYALKLDPTTTATLSNLAGGLVCEKVGVVPVDKQQLLKEAIKLKL
ncbi:MAG: D-glycero-beta-D-manno-heptose-7-phosphate kinase [Bacteroidetes bacterium]|nr:D-glycero-beta-D-manno-heptose-7-phosphate kinase [Bacteroidota bacterium]